MEPKSAQKAAYDFAMAHLELAAAMYGPDVAIARANGLAWAARDYVFNKRGARAAYDMHAELADGAIVPVLPK